MTPAGERAGRRGVRWLGGLPFRREERLGRLARAFDPFTIITPRGVRLLPVVEQQ